MNIIGINDAVFLGLIAFVVGWDLFFAFGLDFDSSWGNLGCSDSLPGDRFRGIELNF